MSIVLVHWDETERANRLSVLRALGHTVQPVTSPMTETLRQLRESPPQAVVIDLSRLPSHGREVAAALRTNKATRLVPLVFVDGDPEKVERVKAILPDARYTHWALIGPVLQHALQHPPKEVVVPAAMASYAASPLPKKLGIAKGTAVFLFDAPLDFETTLGQLPEGATIQRNPKGKAKSHLTVIFAKSADDLERRFEPALRLLADQGTLWIAWPKKASGIFSDLNQQRVREFGFSRGLVDFKVCAIDAIWSGFRFSRRRAE